jgi:hypothetical protein
MLCFFVFLFFFFWFFGNKRKNANLFEPWCSLSNVCPCCFANLTLLLIFAFFLYWFEGNWRCVLLLIRVGLVLLFVTA